MSAGTTVVLRCAGTMVILQCAGTTVVLLVAAKRVFSDSWQICHMALIMQPSLQPALQKQHNCERCARCCCRGSQLFSGSQSFTVASVAGKNCSRVHRDTEPSQAPIWMRRQQPLQPGASGCPGVALGNCRLQIVCCWRSSGCMWSWDRAAACYFSRLKLVL